MLIGLKLYTLKSRGYTIVHASSHKGAQIVHLKSPDHVTSYCLIKNDTVVVVTEDQAKFNKVLERFVQ